MKIQKFISHKLFLTLILFLVTLQPAFAQTTSQSQGCSENFETITDLLQFGTCFLSRSLVPLLIMVALIIFMSGVVRFIANANDENKRKEGRQFMLWGIIGLFVMLAIWGILQIIGNTVGVGVGIPQL